MNELKVKCRSCCIYWYYQQLFHLLLRLLLHSAFFWSHPLQKIFRWGFLYLRFFSTFTENWHLRIFGDFIFNLMIFYFLSDFSHLSFSLLFSFVRSIFTLFCNFKLLILMCKWTCCSPNTCDIGEHFLIIFNFRRSERKKGIIKCQRR